MPSVIVKTFVVPEFKLAKKLIPLSPEVAPDEIGEFAYAIVAVLDT